MTSQSRYQVIWILAYPFHAAQVLISGIAPAGGAYALKGMYEETVAEVQKHRALRNPPSDGVYLANLANAAALAGRRDEALKIMKENRALVAGIKQPVGIVAIYSAIGDKNEAFRWLETAFEERDPDLPVRRWDPEFDGIRSAPRYQDLLRRMNFPP